MAYDWAIDTRLNTYAVRDQLRALGCRWNKDQAAWMARDEVMWRKGMDIAIATGEAQQRHRYHTPRSVIQSRRDNAQARSGDYYSSGRYDDSGE